ncbi:MAG: carboxymuconolactone decarboxylase family protein [Solirubrobacteraceae bacterium]
MDAPPAARIEPGARRDIGVVNFGIARLLGFATGGGPPNVFTTLARHRRLFRRWLRFAGALMPGGLLARSDSEVVILRVAHNCGCEYEWHHHERLGRLAGLSAEEVQRVRRGADADGWSERCSLLLAAADELHAQRTISDPLWGRLAQQLSQRELIELCLLVGHYEMLAMTLNALQVRPDPLPTGPPPRALRALQSLIERRRGRVPAGRAA